MFEQRFAVPLGGFTFKGAIDRVHLIQGTKNEIEIIDYNILSIILLRPEIAFCHYKLICRYKTKELI